MGDSLPIPMRESFTVNAVFITLKSNAARLVQTKLYVCETYIAQVIFIQVKYQISWKLFLCCFHNSTVYMYKHHLTGTKCFFL